MQQNKDGVHKLFKQFGLFSLTLALSSSLLSAGSFEDFKRSQAESFKKYKDERDVAFNKFLKAQWKAYNAHKGVKVYEEPKPEKIPAAKPKEIEKVGPLVHIKVPKVVKKVQPMPMPKVEPKPVIQPKPKVVEKTIEQPKEKIIEKVIVIPTPEVEKPVEVVKKDINFDFFGTSVGFNISQGLKDANFYPTNQTGIANYFDKVASSEYKGLIEDVQELQKELSLNDWGVYLLVNELSKKVYSDNDNSKLLAWFIFNKLGYAVKVGLANKHVVLLHFADKIIYSTPNYSFGKNKFYVVSNYAKGSVGRLYSYEQNYPGSDKPLDLSLDKLPSLAENLKSKELGFKGLGDEFKVSINYNKNLIDFMGTYPQADYETFFNAPLEDATFAQLAEAIKKHVDGKKMSEALNFVLHFVQKSFKYEMDNQQFGREKVMFAQETLYYDKSDCEDRAVLFSKLVKKLFGVNVVGVKYKDHMATALYIPMDGDYVKAGSKKFVLADPTYINSSIGQSMPKYKPKKPESFIVVKK
ncbi:hypothetical protein [Sulfurimonas sp.]|uniref:hypothetical protein n=1 Tax=Sulfurimonas sp. TaxID=2022749 RepID=UPI003566D7CB